MNDFGEDQYFFERRYNAQLISDEKVLEIGLFGCGLRYVRAVIELK